MSQPLMTSRSILPLFSLFLFSSFSLAPHDIRVELCSHLACRLEEKPVDAAVAEVNMCAAPTPEGYQQPQGMQPPLYAALIKKVSRKADSLIFTACLSLF